MKPNNELIDTFRGMDLSPYRSPLITIFTRPLDYPDHKYIARLFDLNHPTPYVVLRDSLDEIRETIPYGLTLLKRDPNDHPSVVEVWL